MFNAVNGLGGAGQVDSKASTDSNTAVNATFSVVGQVVSGMEFVDKIKRGAGSNGEVSNPDKMIKVTVGKK
jgi:peptidyl-prolyl cis-trans isomerase A (cyclophilin A)